MTGYEPDSNERIDSRTERALILGRAQSLALQGREDVKQYLTVLADVRRAKGADDLFLVVSQSGTEYLINTRINAYECPDRGHRMVHLIQDGGPTLLACDSARGRKHCALSSRAAGPFGWSEKSAIPHDLRVGPLS